MQKGVIIVLGSANDERGRLIPIGEQRGRMAYGLYRANPDWKLLLTGGFGEHFNRTFRPHALYMKNFLISLGVPEADILPLVESRNTIEDAQMAKPLLLERGCPAAVVVTSDYHWERARFVFQRTFRDTALSLFFVVTETDEDACGIDLVSQRMHEARALKKLMEKGF